MTSKVLLEAIKTRLLFRKCGYSFLVNQCTCEIRASEYRDSVPLVFPICSSL